MLNERCRIKTHNFHLREARHVLYLHFFYLKKKDFYHIFRSSYEKNEILHLYSVISDVYRKWGFSLHNSICVFQDLQPPVKWCLNLCANTTQYVWKPIRLFKLNRSRRIATYWIKMRNGSVHDGLRVLLCLRTIGSWRRNCVSQNMPEENLKRPTWTPIFIKNFTNFKSNKKNIFIFFKYGKIKIVDIISSEIENKI